MSFSHSLTCLLGWLPAVFFNNNRLIIITGLLKEHRFKSLWTQWLEISLWMSGMEAYDISNILILHEYIQMQPHILTA